MQRVKTTEDMLHALVLHVPELRPEFDEHVEWLDGGLFPHLFMGDVTRFVMRHLESIDHESSRVLVDRVVDFLESYLETNPVDCIDNVIGASFIENLQPWDSAHRRYLRPRLGPLLAEMASYYED